MKIIYNSNFSVHKVYIYWGYNHTCLFLYYLGFFHATIAELSSHNKTSGLLQKKFMKPCSHPLLSCSIASI